MHGKIAANALDKAITENTIIVPYEGNSDFKTKQHITYNYIIHTSCGPDNIITQ